ncbi:hypothetical protein TPSD3_04815 [Thioflexithrix psekupsensis]|uniref:Transcriptional regulator HTH-type FeoC domain-containing protein n=2 Tax=Thioflexithrix psekupsensis TaxID=1570016 RepID=A0A251X9P3_9GAMM|nr:hypothetical protein TPSD3_04815 [Thioflexithrix psekupsensis]
MGLLDIKKYLMQHRRATLLDLSSYFNTDAQILMPMLAHWERKGKVRRVHFAGSCQKGCCQQQSAIDVYEWVEHLDLT